MKRARRIPRCEPEAEMLDLTGGLTDQDLDKMKEDPAFQRMADEVDRAERSGEPTIPHEEGVRWKV